jgi:hypothetical protein
MAYQERAMELPLLPLRHHEGLKNQRARVCLLRNLFGFLLQALGVMDLLILTAEEKDLGRSSS